MLRALVVVVLSALALAPGAAAMAPRDAGTGGDTVIGFDDLASGTTVTTQYASSGVTFGQGPGSLAAVPPKARANAAARSAPNLATIGFTPEAGVPHSNEWMAFASPQSHVALYVGDPYDTTTTVPHTVELDAYDAAGNKLTSATTTVVKAEPVDKPLSVDAGGPVIAYAQVHDLQASDGSLTGGVAIDDLTFGTGGGGLAVTATEGAAFNGIVAHTTGSNPGPVTIDWGDGTTSPGTVAPSGLGYDISGTHTYAEEGADTVVVRGGAGTLARAAMTVVDAPLSATSVGTIDTALLDQPGHVNQFQALARFTDADPAAAVGDYRATVDWGDGSAPQPGQVNASRDGFFVNGVAHDYPANQDQVEKRYTITVTVDDAGGAESVAHSFATVPAVPAPPPENAPAGLCPPISPGAAGTIAHAGSPTTAPDGTIRQTLTFGTLIGGGAWGAGSTFTLVAHGCWAFAGYTHDYSQDAWIVHGADVEFNGFTLRPVDPANTALQVDTAGDFSGVNPSGSALFDILTPDEHGGLRPIGRTDLGRYPWIFDDGLLGHFGPVPGGPTFGTGHVVSGDVRVPPHTDATSVIDAAMQMPSTFGSNPEGGDPPTGDLHLVLAGPGADQSSEAPPGGGECTDNCVTNPNGPHPGCCHATRTTLDGSVDTNGHLHLEIADLYIGALDVQDAFLDYNPDDTPDKGGLWRGGGDMFFGPVEVNAAPPPDDMGFGIFGDGEFDFAGAQANFTPPAQIGPVSLYSVGAHIRTHPTVFRGNVLLGVADVLKVDGGVLLVFASHHEPYTYRQGDLENVDALQRDTQRRPVTGFAVGASGQGSIDLGALGEKPIANVYGFYTSGYFEFAGGLNLDLGIVNFDADVKGAFDTDRGLYDVDAKVHACAPALDSLVDGGCLFGMDGHLSSYGVGACADVGPISAGFRDKWGGPSSGADGVTIFLLGCSSGMGPITVDLNAGARAAQAGGATSFVLADSPPDANITVHGTGGAPAVEITGPGGVHAQTGTPAVDPRAGGAVVMATDETNAQTIIGLRHPARGRWTITPLPGSVPIASVSHAEALPPAHISATVARPHRRGGRMVLRYHVTPRPGQTVLFAERASGVFHVLGSAKGTHGTLAFTPAPGAGGTRTIVAQVTLSGTPAGDVTAGRYTAPKPQPLAAARRLRIARAGGGVQAHWSRIPGASQVLVDFRLTSGAHLTTTLSGGATSAQVSKVLPGVGAKVTVTGLDAQRALGRAAHLTLPAAPPPGRVRGLHAKRHGATATLRWRAVPGALRYAVRVTVRGEKQPRLLFARRSPFSLTALPSGRVTVRVQAVGPGGRSGRSATVRMR